MPLTFGSTALIPQWSHGKTCDLGNSDASTNWVSITPILKLVKLANGLIINPWIDFSNSSTYFCIRSTSVNKRLPLKLLFMGELLFNGYVVSVWESKKVLEMDGGDGCQTMWIYFMSLNCMFKNGKLLCCVYITTI